MLSKLFRFLVILIVPALWAVEPTTISPYGRCLTYSAPVGQKLSPDLKTILDTLSTGARTRVIITLARQADLSGFPREAKAEMVAFLKEFARLEQADIKAYLNTCGKKVTKVEPFWVFNGLVMDASRDVIEAISVWRDVGCIGENRIIQHDPMPSELKPNTLFTTDYPWNISKIRVPEVWNRQPRGYTGLGIVVGNMDSGVRVSHEVLTGKWRGEGQLDPENHWFDAVEGRPTPFDCDELSPIQGHGTMTMGIMCGGNEGTPSIGVAPDAKFICARAFWWDEGLNMLLSDDEKVSSCIQWYAELWGKPEPRGADVINLSFGDNFHKQFPTHWFSLRNLRDLGTIPVCAVGNTTDGPYVKRPANYPVVIGVGATTESDYKADFSCIGPAPEEYPYTVEDDWGRPDWNLIKPDIMAPGGSIHSNNNESDYSYCDGSGTSFAAPHVVGSIALMLEAIRSRCPSQSQAYRKVYNLLLDNSYHLPDTTYPNYRFGWGRVDALDAVNAAVQDLPSWEYSWSPHATAFNYNRHLSVTAVPLPRPGSNWKYWFAYESGDTIYETHWTEGYLNRSEPETVAVGEFPGLATKEIVAPGEAVYHGIFYLNDKFPYLALHCLDNVWRFFPCLDEVHPLGFNRDDVECGPVSGVFGSFVGSYQNHILKGAVVFPLRRLNSVGGNPTVSSYIVFVSGAYNSQSHQFTIAEPVILDSYLSWPDQTCENCCIAVTPGDIYHVVWEKYSANFPPPLGDVSDIFYKVRGVNGQWLGPVNLSAYSAGGYSDVIRSTHPFVEAYGYKVFVTWAEGNTNKTVVQRYRYVNEPNINIWVPALSGIPTPISLSGYSSDYPTKSTSAYTTWMQCDNPDGNWDIWFDYRLDSGYQEQAIISDPYNLDNCRFPHACPWVFPNDIYFGTIWTQGDNIPYWMPFDLSQFSPPPQLFANASPHPDYPLIYYRTELGDSLPSPYCLKRTGFEHSRNHKVDYGSQLIYKLPYLDQSKFYLLRAVVYTAFQSEFSTNYQQQFSLDKLVDTTITYQAGRPETVDIWIRPDLQQDNQIILEVTGTSKLPAYLEEIRMYQFDWVDKLLIEPQITGVEGSTINPVPFFQIIPSPSSRAPEIRYQLSENQSQISLKVYDVSGQMVRDFSKTMSRELGVHSIRWNGKDGQGKTLPAGFYFFQLETNATKLNRKVVLVR